MKIKITEIGPRDSHRLIGNEQKYIGKIGEYRDVRMWDDGWYYGWVILNEKKLNNTHLGSAAFFQFKFEEVKP